ncbi:MAG: DUF924 family protein [Gammaproteobacteria bacterium]
MNAEGRVAEILVFWFGDVALAGPVPASRRQRWFAVDSTFDAEVARRFGTDVDAACRGALTGWGEQPGPCLALILLLDQFTRNIHRGRPHAFVGDEAALAAARGAISAGHDHALGTAQKVFLYMPFQHAEELDVQEAGVALFEALAEQAGAADRELAESVLEFARLHRDIVRRFGRFPHRNALLGRETTDAERAYLAGDAPSFGQRADEDA